MRYEKVRVPVPDEFGVSNFNPPLTLEDHFDIAMVREYPSWQSATREEGTRVQLGAGLKQIDGWLNLEYPEWDADEEIPFSNESVSHIASYHTLDHLTPEQVINTLAEAQRVLVPGGVFTNIVPHYMSQLANECIQHRSRFAIDTFRNIFSERQYKQFNEIEWKLRVGYNMVMGLTERNLVLVTQLIKES